MDALHVPVPAPDSWILLIPHPPPAQDCGTIAHKLVTYTTHKTLCHPVARLGHKEQRLSSGLRAQSLAWDRCRGYGLRSTREGRATKAGKTQEKELVSQEVQAMAGLRGNGEP